MRWRDIFDGVMWALLCFALYMVLMISVVD